MTAPTQTFAGVVQFSCLTCHAPVSLPPSPTHTQPLTCPGCSRVYDVDGGIVLLGERHAEDDVNQPDEYYGLMVQIEARHFWFDARNRVVQAALTETLGPLPGRSLLDIGCGTGYVLGSLDRSGMRTCGIDMHLECLRFARARSLGAILCASAYGLPFETQFDAAILCDVIEHVDDDVRVLREAARVVKPGGVVLVTVPAHQWLWSALDDVAVHRRRYERASLQQAFAAAGLEARIVRYFNTLLTPLQLAQRLLIRKQRTDTAEARERIVRASMRPPPALLNQALALATRFDVPLGRLGIPFGPSLVAAAVKA